jgi:monomeric sarcosine oxidase
MKFDVAVIGTGAMGGSAAYHLAKSGASVIAFDQFTVPHDRGSSHADTRLIRQAYFEDPDYVPLLRRAYELWEDLEEEPGQLFVKSGLFIAGRPDRTVMQGVKRSATEHQIRTETLGPQEASRRFPGFSFAEDEICIFEPEAGYLNVDQVLQAHLAGAAKAGAQIRQNTEVTAIKRDAGGYVISTGQGEFRAKKVVLAGGAWNGQLMTSLLGHRLVPHRVPLFWFPVIDRTKEPAVCFAYDLPEGFFYGFRPFDGLVKAGLHKPGPVIPNPTNYNRTISDEERDPVRRFFREKIVFADSSIAKEATCIYTMTADEHFIIDEVDGMVILAGFSGHGFKFASVVGEIAKDLALTGKSHLPYEFLRLR